MRWAIKRPQTYESHESYNKVRDSEAPSGFTEKRLGLLSALRRHVETRFQVRPLRKLSRNYVGWNRNRAESHFRGSFGVVTEAVAEIRSASKHHTAAITDLTTWYSEWVSKVLTSHLTHCRSFQKRFFTGQMTQPTVSKHWRKPVGHWDQTSVPPGPLHRVTMKKLKATASKHSAKVKVWQKCNLMDQYTAKKTATRKCCTILYQEQLCKYSLYSRDRGIMRKNFANYAQQF